MGKSRGGFKLGRKVVKIFKWVICSKRKPTTTGYTRLLHDSNPDNYYCNNNSNNSCKKKTMMTKIIQNWGQRLKRQAKELCHIKPCATAAAVASQIQHRHYRHLNAGEVEAAAEFERKQVAVPKGHLAVYVEAQKGGGGGDHEAERHRFLVPVIYFNHPLFGELLREAEKEYGYHQPGGITIPCPISEFQNVQARIGAACRKATWKHLL